MPLHVQHDSQKKKFFIILDGQEAILKYTEIPNKKVLDYRSTFVPPELRGKQVGETLVKSALDYAKQNGIKIIPTCSFVKRVIDQHPEYKSLVAK